MIAPTVEFGWSFRQPWPEAILGHGMNVITRGRMLSRTGWVAIRAAQTPPSGYSQLERNRIRDTSGRPLPAQDQLRLGGVVGIMRITGAHFTQWGRECCQPWGEPPPSELQRVAHIKITDAIRLPEIVPCGGGAGWGWRLDPLTAAAVNRQLREVAA